mmetsp:Transcript_4584/g.8145  ORF Transcript_4584/g.8145 Transcript_4584/m.8145 type:complete len:229 (+) Transcript_4584:555-1241(+)
MSSICSSTEGILSAFNLFTLSEEGRNNPRRARPFCMSAIRCGSVFAAGGRDASSCANRSSKSDVLSSTSSCSSCFSDIGILGPSFSTFLSSSFSASGGDAGSGSFSSVSSAINVKSCWKILVRRRPSSGEIIVVRGSKDKSTCIDELSCCVSFGLFFGGGGSLVRLKSWSFSNASAVRRASRARNVYSRLCSRYKLATLACSSDWIVQEDASLLKSRAACPHASADPQ